MESTPKRTYPRVTKLLEEAVAEKGQRTVAREAGIPLLSVQRYLKGIGEPTTATLEKLAKYFGVSVAWLRGETILPADNLDDYKRFVKGHETDKLGVLLFGQDADFIMSLAKKTEKATCIFDSLIEKICNETGLSEEDATCVLSAQLLSAFRDRKNKNTDTLNEDKSLPPE